MAFNLASLCPLVLLCLASMPRVYQPAAAPAINSAPSLLLGNPTAILNSGRFNTAEPSAWTQLFTNWATTMNKVYSTPAAEQQALDNFISNSLTIMEHNAQYRAGQQNYALGLHYYSDMTFSQFEKKMLGLNPAAAPWGSASLAAAPMDDGPLAAQPAVAEMATGATLNYTSMGCVTPVKNQGGCGSCWAFGSTGAIESAYCKATGGILNSFSEEQIIDCDTADYGCGGGWPTTALDYVKAQGGLATESAYPYVAGNTGVATACRASQVSNVNMELDYTVIAQDDPDLLNALQNVGPITVGMAVGDGFFGYSSGVMNPVSACGTVINHVVLLVGYGVDPLTGYRYWLCKNSWGTTWGENGYFRLNSIIANSCQINRLAVSVTVVPN